MNKVPQFRLLLGGAVIIAVLAAIGLFYRLGASRTSADGERPTGTIAASRESPASQPAADPDTHQVRPYAGVEDIELPEETQALARWFGPGPKNLEDAQVAWQIREDKYVQFLKDESFVKSLQRAYILSELLHVRGTFDVLAADNPAIAATLSKSRRFSKLLAYVNRSKSSGGVGRAVDLLHENARWYLTARANVEKKILKLMADEPELFRAGVKLSERQRHRLVDVFHGFGTVARTVPELPMSMKGTSLGVVTISLLLGQTEDVRAVRPLLEIASRDDATFLRRLNKPGNRRTNGYPTANRDVIADALDRILVAEAGRAAESSSSGKVAKDYLQWRKNAKLPERKTVRVYAYDERVTPHGLVGAFRRPGPGAKTVELALPMMEKNRQVRELPSKEMAKKIDTILEWAKRLQAAGD